PSDKPQEHSAGVYDELIQEADALFEESKFEEAKRKYQEVLDQHPNDAYATEKVKACEQEIAKNQKEAERQSSYSKYINHGNRLFDQGKFEEAKAKYEAALVQKPGDGYAKAKIENCDQIISEKQKEAEGNRLYTKYKSEGDRYFNQGKYTQAKQKYQQALNYKPGDSYLLARIGECDRRLAEADKPKAPPDMVLIPAGTFEMGSNDGDDDEKPVHKVSVDAFYMDKYEVTVEQYAEFLNATNHRKPANWTEQLQNPKRPVVYVSWNDAVAYTEWLSQKTGQTYRLPTEAEWEYAARGGNTGYGGKPKYRYPWGDDASPDKANYRGTGGKDRWQGTSPRGSFDPNGYGLYDMAGNVWEWCSDWYASDYYENSPEKNPKGPATGDYRVLRGGSWNYGPLGMRCAFRFRNL
ncbi:SUMF1/EgtB/PvdO family nonheme iron enzyme, partial [candidate division KSB1 bacterium]|nr:SUMF1/EgtB/PvdO family nonheme iron enzyme [candidate division KSB1 bacterium]NIS23536.1 SUMF1/EgtB/PvdO family nonheme iron enzyme [candidate division KSB1 bacterium]NIT73478.1 SUMF1/EgtB/PvdO family nonheme iron enzyme [candidate division KSB1 bacterium]NIU28778.1 SUMF1/EgtB/PvdO family nonheme iron enzyme [candidate division KSB1 bacterium]NIU93462.1 SUMF1/EgtB/PvdO family nonheme iron enzyme [candidate division KSB1 bacterium]